MRTSARVISLCARAFAIGLLALVMSACSRTVTWEEEVPLNTGETIWIERSMPWEMRGSVGNPFDIAMRPSREQTISFTYRGATYRYRGRANVLWIAISPDMKPTLIAPAGDYGWYSANNYYCVVPYYVQFVPSPDGQHWTWPQSIEPWLYNLPANVMTSIPRLNEDRKRRYTRGDRDNRDAVSRLQVPAASRIDPNYKAGSCIARVKRNSDNHLDWRDK